MKMNNERIFRIPFATVYDLLVQKALRKNRTQRKSIGLFPGLRVTAFRKSGKMPSTGRLSHILGKCSDN